MTPLTRVQAERASKKRTRRARICFISFRKNGSGRRVCREMTLDGKGACWTRRQAPIIPQHNPLLSCLQTTTTLTTHTNNANPTFHRQGKATHQNPQDPLPSSPIFFAASLHHHRGNDQQQQHSLWLVLPTSTRRPMISRNTCGKKRTRRTARRWPPPPTRSALKTLPALPPSSVPRRPPL